MAKKYQNIIVIIVTLVLVIGGLIWLSYYSQKKFGAENQSNASLSNGILVSENPAFDFGTISMAAGNVSHIFRIKNTGAEPLTINKIYTSCMCTKATFMKNGEKEGPFGMLGHGYLPKINQVLAVGEEADVEVVFDPAAHGPAGLGKIERVVYIENNTGKALKLAISANVAP